jgi:pyruvate-formate lyase-activating enzyme
MASGLFRGPVEHSIGRRELSHTSSSKAVRRFADQPRKALAEEEDPLHLVDYLALRAIPAAGISLALTRRCPLSCAHCATNSTFSSEEAPADMFTRFVDTFTVDDHPQVLAISGGEAFLRPALLQDLAERAALVGCKTAALSGMFWAKSKRIPPPIKRAIDSLDHFSCSLDVFHEKEVRRADVYRALDTLLSEGKDVSMHLVGLDADDPYLAERTEEIRDLFDGRVPMLVNAVNSYGRAADWLEREDLDDDQPIEANPCALAAWPLIAFDGTAVACGNDDVVDGPAPAHLRLGHADIDSWATIRARTLTSNMLRAIRTFGPEYLNERHGSGTISCEGYCATCRQFPDDPALVTRVEEMMERPSGALMEEHVVALQRHAGGTAFIRRFGMPRYADLITLGAPATAGAPS